MRKSKSHECREIVSRVLYRDALMLVIDKPAGLPVHPGPKGGETLTHHLDALRFGLPRRPEAAHRLDRDTSGCLMLGRHPKALARLNELFRKNEVDKVYWAVVEGGPEADEGEIDLPLMPKSPDRGWWMKVDPKGQPSLTQWRVLGLSPPPGGRSPAGGRWRESRHLDRHPTVAARPTLPLKGRLIALTRARTPAAPISCASIAPPSGLPILGDRSTARARASAVRAAPAARDIVPLTRRRTVSAGAALSARPRHRAGDPCRREDAAELHGPPYFGL